MSGIILLMILVIWFYIVRGITKLIMLKTSKGRLRSFISMMVFSLLFIAPVADEIIGGFQFRALCMENSYLIYDVEKIKGKTVVWSGTPRTIINNTIIPIEVTQTRWRDQVTGEVLIAYKQYFATGGWLSRSISFDNVTRPYVFNGVCGVKDELTKVLSAFNITTVYK